MNIISQYYSTIIFIPNYIYYISLCQLTLSFIHYFLFCAFIHAFPMIWQYPMWIYWWNTWSWVLSHELTFWKIKIMHFFFLLINMINIIFILFLLSILLLILIFASDCHAFSFLMMILLHFFLIIRYHLSLMVIDSSFLFFFI